MPPKAKPKVQTLKGDNAKDLVRDYMLEQNRPFNAVTIVANLHNQVGKADATRILDGLVSEGVLQSKDYKSLRYYWANQGLNFNLFCHLLKFFKSLSNNKRKYW
jgi:26S proteasome regulatory subunit, ATPase 3, interacting protein